VQIKLCGPFRSCAIVLNQPVLHNLQEVARKQIVEGSPGGPARVPLELPLDRTDFAFFTLCYRANLTTEDCRFVTL
jgi:hypothetical protein